jgi:cell division cycle 20-like protein 1 (cofactor of APC complex)
MYHHGYEKRLLKPTNSDPHQVMEGCSLSTPIFYSPTKLSNNSFDRFIPTRLGNNWQTTFSMISESNRSGVVSKKTRENNGEGNRDGIAYSCLLKNELLGIVYTHFI